MSFSICILQFARIFILLPDPDGNIRTDLPADSAAGARPLIIPVDVEISLPVDLLPDPDQSFRAGNRAKPTSLATFNVNFDLRHHRSNAWNNGILECWVNHDQQNLGLSVIPGLTRNPGFSQISLRLFVREAGRESLFWGFPVIPLFQYSIIPVSQTTFNSLRCLMLSAE